MSVTRIRLGVIGLGAMGAELLQVALAHDEYDVVVAADLSPAARAAAADAHPDLTLVADAADVLAADVDAVYVATPPGTHGRIVLPALERGLAVFCEKPLAIDLQEGLAMAAAANDRVAAVNFALSDRAATLEIERAIGAGELGELRSVEIRLAFPVWPRSFQADAAWLAEGDEGGFLREVFSHFAYLTDRLVGHLQPVWTSLSRPSPALAETSAVGVLAATRTDGGRVPVRVWAEAGSARPETYEWTLHGTRASYRLTDWGTLQVSTGDAWTPVETPGERGSEHSRLTAFADLVRSGAPVAGTNLADFGAALRVQQLVEGWLGHSER